MPSTFVYASKGDTLCSRISSISRIRTKKGLNLKKRWLAKFVTSTEGNRFIKPINKLQRTYETSTEEGYVRKSVVEDVEEDTKHDEEPLPQTVDLNSLDHENKSLKGAFCDKPEGLKESDFNSDDEIFNNALSDESDSNDDMFDNWMPNDSEENETLLVEEDYNDPGLRLDNERKLVEVEDEVEHEKKKLDNTLTATEEKLGDDVNLIETTDSKSDVQTIIGEIPMNQSNISATELGVIKNKLTTNYTKKKNTHDYVFKCNVCKDKFKTNRVLIRHKERFGSSGCIKPFQCKDCDKSYKTPEQLISHSDYCSGKNYECIVCHKNYPNSYQLKYHQMLHASVTRFPCTVCGKGFKRPSDLRSHERIHNDEKKFKCDVCKKGFKFSGTLQKHKTVHTSRRPFPCNKCDQSFKSTSILARHIMTHDTNRSSTCNQCGIQIKCKFYMQQHKKLHNGKIYNCPVCSKTFAAKSYLKAHKKRLLHDFDDFDITDTVSDLEYV